MSMAKITFEVPRATWERFVRIANKHKRPTGELLIQLIQSYTATDGRLGFYGRLTRHYLAGQIKRTGSINAFRFSADTVSAIQTTYGTAEAMELIDRVRHRQ